MVRVVKFLCFAFGVAAGAGFGCGQGSLWAGVLDEAVWFKRPVGAGVTWKYYHFDNLFGAKQSVSVTEVDLNEPSVGFSLPYRNSYVGPSPGTGSPLYPRALTSTLAGGIPNARAAVNGTYFNINSYSSANPSAAWGGGITYLKVGGTVVHSFDGGDPNLFGMGILFDDRNDFLITRRFSAWADVQANWSNMMICGPVLLVNSFVESYDPSNSHANLRHPRTAVGKNTTGRKVYFVTVDGRSSQAAGMSCTELALVMKDLGCDYAINLDGGGSTTMWINGEPDNGVVNYPTDNGTWDHGGQRAAANAIVVTSAAPATPGFDARLTGVSYPSSVVSHSPATLSVSYVNIGAEPWTNANSMLVPSRRFDRACAFIRPDNTYYCTMSPSVVFPGESGTFTLSLVAPAVASTTVYEEHFALWHRTQGYFGPPDGAVEARYTVTPRAAVDDWFLY